jgi:transcriptional regulator with GAF, ATPase, and Fis domain
MVESPAEAYAIQERAGFDASTPTMIGRSVALRRLLHELDIVAPTDVTVLIHGETGTGKELVAAAIHKRSARGGTLVKVNCAAVPGSLIESELMGHEKGAFTGAWSRRIGRFEAADRGTLFLDEIAEMPLETQPKLLRVLQEREFERLGSNETIRTDARLVAATNRDLQRMAAERGFREDLYYRLNVFPLYLPPLRDRREDIPALAHHFAETFAHRTGRSLDPLPEDFMKRLCAYEWPGNVRELKNVVERAAIFARDGAWRMDTLACLERASFAKTADGESTSCPSRPGSEPLSAEATPRSDRLDDVDRRHILAVLEATNWVVGGPHGAAARLGMKRPTLIYRMKKLGIARSNTTPFDAAARL